MSKSTLQVALVAAAFAFFISSSAFPAGFEKSVFWSGHYAGIAGAAQSSVTGPESLYWNPAGLGGSTGLQVAGDFSPTWVSLSGPFAVDTAAGSIGTTINSSTSFLPIGGGFVSYGLTPQWGVGVGYYVTAGTKSDYSAVPNTLASGTWNAPVNADLTMTELSLGTGYEILPGLKLGAAYRVLFVSGTLNEQNVVPATEVVSVQTSGISQTRWGGLRVGLMYAPKDSGWGVGVTYRNQIRINANGTTNVLVATSGTANPTTTQSNESTLVSATLPQQLNLAAHYIFTPTLTGFLGYTFSNYSADQTLGLSGVNAGTGVTDAFSIPLNWTNMHNIRAALEYDGIQDWAIRGGYVWTSQVTPAQYALPIIDAPGTGNTVVVGTGHKIASGLTGDAAFEYSWDSGTVGTSPAPAATTAAGNYSAHAIAVHLGLTYAM